MIYTLGESLLDIIFTGEQKIIANAGGGMLNTSVSLVRKGLDVSLISELGDDKTAMEILKFLDENQIKTKHIKKYFQQNTSIAVAHLDENKVPSFSIYKSYPSKRQLIKPQLFTSKDFLIFGSLYSIDPNIRNDIKEIASHAKTKDAILCYDPNIRSHDLSISELRNALFENIAYADIVKASNEDMKNIFGDIAPDEFYKEVKKVNQQVMFILTLGKDGAIGYSENNKLKISAKPINVVNTIGAGDAFNAGIIFYLCQNRVKKQDLVKPVKKVIEGLLKSGTAFSAAVCASQENYLPKIA